MLFNWLRRKAAEAVALGVADGVRAVAPEDEQAPDLAGLRLLVAEATVPKSLPPAVAEEEPTSGRKTRTR